MRRLSPARWIADGYLVESGESKPEKERTAVKKVYQVVSQSQSAEVRRYLAEHGHALLPVIEVIASGAQAVEELISELGKVALEAVLQLSADEVAGPPHRGSRAGQSGATGAREGWWRWGARR